MASLSNSEEFIEKAQKIHNDVYDYSLVNYINNYTKIKILCKKHGIFEQTPANHLKFRRCPKCFGKFTKTKEKFIEDAVSIHGVKYNYSLVKYINDSTKIKIICNKNKHIFEQIPNAHLRGQGCPKCLGFYKTNEEFIFQSRKIHGEIYDYSMVNYINATSKVKIICKIHGIFEKTPNNHLDKNKFSGCPKCNQSIGEKKIYDFLLNNNIPFEFQKKFNGCKNKRNLIFDFYLSKHNLCIEYNGIQHYEEKDYFGGENSLNYIKNNDNIKNNYCENNNINLLIIKYNEDVITKLSDLKINKNQ